MGSGRTSSIPKMNLDDKVPFVPFRLPDFRKAWKELREKAREELKPGDTERLHHDVSPIFNSSSNSAMLAPDFNMNTYTGASLKGLERNKPLQKLLQHLHDEKLLIVNSTHFNFTHNGRGVKFNSADFFHVRWTALLAGNYTQERPVVVEMNTTIHIDNKYLIDDVQVDSWLVNGRHFPMWPSICLSDELEVQLSSIKDWTQTIQKIQALSPLEQKSRARELEEARKLCDVNSTEQQSIYVVDFGSQSSRATLVQLSDGSASSVPVKGFKGIALQNAVGDPKLREALLNQIAEVVPSGARILGGGTEGVRFALDHGVITRAQVDDFAKAFKERLGDKADFSILTPEQEAQAEWKSIENALRNMNPRYAHENDLPLLGDISGMVSSGGLSCQLALRHGDLHGIAEPMSFHSFRNMIGEEEHYIRSHKIMANSTEFKERLSAFKSRIRENINASSVHGLKGVYVLIEFWRVLSYKSPESPGLDPYKAHLVSDVRTTIEEWLEYVLASGEALTGKMTATILLSTVALVVFQDLFDPSARICIIGGKDMTWSIGWAVEHLSPAPTLASDNRIAQWVLGIATFVVALLNFLNLAPV
jgi:hypothetical protein